MARSASAGSRTESTFVALLRGINVGGKNKLPMRDLVAIFEDAGCASVRTYIQSGNVVFTASAGVVKRLARDVAERIATHRGLSVPVVLRTAGEWGEAVDRNPYIKKGADPGLLFVAFLADAPAPERLAELDADRSPGDEFVVRGREIYLYLPNGAARTKLTNAYLDSRLQTVSTVRNWRSVLALRDMLTTN